MSKNTKNRGPTRDLFAPTGPDNGPDDFEMPSAFDLERNDYVAEVIDRTAVGKPRFFNLSGWNTVHIRIVDPKLDFENQASAGAVNSAASRLARN